MARWCYGWDPVPMVLLYLPVEGRIYRTTTMVELWPEFDSQVLVDLECVRECGSEVWGCGYEGVRRRKGGRTPSATKHTSPKSPEGAV